MLTMLREPLLPNRSRKEWLRRLDRIAADLNVLLIAFAIGLATLDLTFLLTQHVIDRLPQTTRVVYATPQRRRPNCPEHSAIPPPLSFPFEPRAGAGRVAALSDRRPAPCRAPAAGRARSRADAPAPLVPNCCIGCSSVMRGTQPDRRSSTRSSR